MAELRDSIRSPVYYCEICTILHSKWREYAPYYSLQKNLASRSSASLRPKINDALKLTFSDGFTRDMQHKSTALILTWHTDKPRFESSFTNEKNFEAVKGFFSRKWPASIGHRNSPKPERQLTDCRFWDEPVMARQNTDRLAKRFLVPWQNVPSSFLSS